MEVLRPVFPTCAAFFTAEIAEIAEKNGFLSSHASPGYFLCALCVLCGEILLL
jgi:hypothetical protein